MVDVKSPIYCNITLLQSAVECEILSPKSKWKIVINQLDSYIEGLETKLAELEKIQDLRRLDSFNG